MPPLAGKVVLNQACGLARISPNRIKGVTTVLKHLTPKASELRKLWFIEMDKIFQERSLKVFYLPVAALQRIIAAEKFGKVPDPLAYFAGYTTMPVYEPAPARDVMFAQKRFKWTCASPGNKLA